MNSPPIGLRLSNGLLTTSMVWEGFRLDEPTRIVVEDSNYITCCCIECAGRIEFPAHGVGQEVQYPHSNQMTRLYDPAADQDLPARPLSGPWGTEAPPAVPPLVADAPLEVMPPRMFLCRTCGGTAASSAEFCIHCGQQWPTLSCPCPYCGADDFDFVVAEDTSSVWITPSLLGILAAALWGVMRPRPKTYLHCLNCGGLARLP